MNRWSTAFCVSVSIVAAGLASFALLQNEPGGVQANVATEERLRQVRGLIATLEERVEALEGTRDTSKRDSHSAGNRLPESRPARHGDPAELHEQIAALTQRLASLEDAETIARLARSGEEQAVENELKGALEELRDPGAAPRARLAALRNLRGLGKSNGAMVESAMVESGLEERDIVLPMLELALDTRLDSDFRSEVVRSLHSKVEELRQPLLDLLAFDEAPAVREGAIDALMYHLGDPAVQESITRVSREDRHEAVRARAERYLPKVQYFVRRTSEATKPAASGAEK